ncbi:hypothetical protein BRC81_13945 [Halobacteriales archaeon QS_1_68_20]|nr:MAG: hypothetical protein BRC81_13945 [Halobacteriales archaeon QS_1_68_20]
MPTDEEDRFGFDDTSDVVGSTVGRLIPQVVARRAVTVTVDTDREVYEVGDPVEITVGFHNRLPVPVSVTTPTKRLWGWSVDGMVGASDERRYMSDTPAVIDFRGGERKRVVHRWNGRFKRTDGRTRWVDPSPGEYELAAFLALDGPDRPEDRTTIRIG